MHKIFCVVDDDSWIQYSRFQVLKERFKNDYCFVNIRRTFTLRQILGKRWIVPCYFFSWRRLLAGNSWKQLPLEKCMASVTSHYNIGGGLNPRAAIGKGQADEKKVFDRSIEVLNRFKVVTVNSMILFDLLKANIPSLVYAPNGVDTEFFAPPEEKVCHQNRTRIGWVGKVKAAKNYELIEQLKPFFEKKNISFKEIAVDKASGTVLSREEMLNFYQSLDYYLCVSWHEGTPNPCLEAASCGVPLITTRVGNMPDLIQDGENGFFIEPTKESVTDKIQHIKNINKDKYCLISNCIRSSIVKDWDWGNRIKGYCEAFGKLVF